MFIILTLFLVPQRYGLLACGYWLGGVNFILLFSLSSGAIQKESLYEKKKIQSKNVSLKNIQFPMRPHPVPIFQYVYHSNATTGGTTTYLLKVSVDLHEKHLILAGIECSDEVAGIGTIEFCAFPPEEIVEERKAVYF